MTHTRLNYLGSNFLIAHVKVRKLHIALGKEILVEEPKGECCAHVADHNQTVEMLLCFLESSPWDGCTGSCDSHSDHSTTDCGRRRGISVWGRSYALKLTANREVGVR